MNAKFTAALVAGMMAVVAIAAGVAYSSQADEPGQVATDPVWLIGSAEGHYIVHTEETIKYDATTFPQIDFNYGAFDSPIIGISVANLSDLEGSTVDDLEEDDFTSVYGETVTAPVDVGDVSIEIVKVVGTPAGDVKYDVKVTAGDTATADDGKEFYLFKVDVTRTGGKFADLAQQIYYAAHIKVTEETILTDRPVTLTSADGGDRDALGGTVYGNTAETALVIQQDTVVDAYAFVQIVDAADEADDEYVWADYDFYAKGLPLGLAMKLDGEISGKVSATVSMGEGNFTVWAVDKNSGEGIYTATIPYKVTPLADSFDVIVDGETKSWADPAYKVIMNTGGLEITIQNPNYDSADDTTYIVPGDLVKPDADTPALYAAYITLDDADVQNVLEVDGMSFAVTADGQAVLTIEEGALGDYTGIMQIQIVKTNPTNVYIAITHVLVVGPVVHSGLMPAVTSN